MKNRWRFGVTSRFLKLVKFERFVCTSQRFTHLFTLRDFMSFIKGVEGMV